MRAPPPGSTRPTRRCAKPSERSPAKPKRPTSGWSATGRPADRRRKWARARHRSAHEIGPRRAKPRGRLEAPDVCALLRQSPAPTNKLPLHPAAGHPAGRYQHAQIPAAGLPVDPNRAHSKRSAAAPQRNPDRSHPEKTSRALDFPSPNCERPSAGRRVPAPGREPALSDDGRIASACPRAERRAPSHPSNPQPPSV